MFITKYGINNEILDSPVSIIIPFTTTVARGIMVRARHIVFLYLDLSMYFLDLSMYFLDLPMYTFDKNTSRNLIQFSGK